MHHLPRIIIAGLLTLAFSTFTIRAEAPTFVNCTLVLEVYAIEKSDALAILESERGKIARYRRVNELVPQHKARLEILTALTTKSGQRAVSESIDEVRYIAEYLPPGSKAGLATPKTVETRNVGDTLEFEPVIGPDGHTCDLNLVPQRVGLREFREIGGMAEDSTVAQPLFETQRMIASTAFPANEPYYLGTLTSATERGVANGDAASEVHLAFLRLNVVESKPDEIKAPEKPVDWSALNLEYSFYSLDRAAARELLAAMPTLNAPWEKLQTLLGEKKARFEHLVSLKTKSGQRSVVEEIQEVRYATGYAPRGAIHSSETTSRTVTTRPGLAVKPQPDPKEDAKATTTTETTTSERVMPNADGPPGAPILFETRNTGVTVEAEPVVGEDGVSIDLNHVVQSVIHLGNLKTAGVAARYPAQPLFETRKLTTSQTLLAGRHMLVGTFNPPGADGVNDRVDTGRTWLVFVRATPNDQ